MKKAWNRDYVRQKTVMMTKIKQWAVALKHNVYALYLAYHHKDVPIVAKVVAVIVVAYALSPIDLIPDFIPVIGYLDDFLLVPLGIALAIWLIPEAVWKECKEKAKESTLTSLPRSKAAAVVVIGIWILTAILLIQLIN
ncbi:DUF1232 domain-containing protein [Sulfurimonas sp. HSL3-7]|uniref:YkvA family protein n=1 Tax=Sulfonitrofixus jiaomeiensis TaxID=3131938 RepID=UPI0031F9D197